MNMIIIHRALESHAIAIAELTAQLGYNVSVESITERLETICAHTDHLMIVAQLGDEVCGWLQAHSAEVIESGARVEVLGLVVAENMRRKGVGRLLVQHAENWAEELGIKTVVVRTNVSRTESHPFYAALGYTHSKTQAVYRKTRGNELPF